MIRGFFFPPSLPPSVGLKAYYENREGPSFSENPFESSVKAISRRNSGAVRYLVDEKPRESLPDLEGDEVLIGRRPRVVKEHARLGVGLHLKREARSNLEIVKTARGAIRRGNGGR